MIRILVTGAGGQLGRAVADALTGPYDVVARSRAELDIADARAMEEAVQEAHPSWVVNCAAYTQVDRAESERETAFRINDLAVGHIADAALAVGARVLHYSTDYVFDGTSSRPYVESDATAPLNVYGASKRAGEERLLAHAVRAAVLRTSWLYSESAANFLRTMLELGSRWRRGDPPLRVVDDQIGTPTDARSLARQSRAVIEAELEGLFHASSQGEATWYGFARAIFEGAGLDVAVEPVGTDEVPRPARRPKYSVLENRELAARGLDRMPAWRADVDAVLERISARGTD